MQSDTVECKPTMWFTGRAVIMALMFLGFGVYFYYDASTGYPQKNLEFFMHKAFVDAGAVFDREVSGERGVRGGLGAHCSGAHCGFSGGLRNSFRRESERGAVA